MATAPTAASPQANKQSTFLGHPIGLYILFFTEMWERFSYYGMRGLLLLYMVNYFKWTQEYSSSIYKWYTSLVYITPLLGGFLADRYLGNKWAIIIGSLLMAVGHFLMAFEAEPIFYSALIFLIVGNGFFKPNMSAQVGRLYPANDSRRDSAYTIFYMGINLGAFLSPLVCGYLQENTRWGYHAGFTAAGIGMALGLIVYLVGLPWVREIATDDGEHDEPVDGTHHEMPEMGHAMTEAEAATTPSVVPAITRIAPQLFYILAAICVVSGLVMGLLGVLKVDNAVAFSLGGGFGSIMAGYISSHVAAALRDRVLAIFAIGAVVVFFWAAFEQAGNVANIYADKHTNRYITETAPTVSPFPDAPAAPVAVATTGPADTSMLDQFTELLGSAFAVSNPEWIRSTKPLLLVLFLVLAAWLFLRTEVKDASSRTKVVVGIVLLIGGLLALMFGPTFADVNASFNPTPTPWFQSINALAIFTMAPVFAWLWVKLPKWGIDLSIASKVAIGVFIQAAAVGLMLFAVKAENKPTSAKLAGLPPGVVSVGSEGIIKFKDAPELGTDMTAVEKYEKNEEEGELSVVHGKRLRFDESGKELRSIGALSDTDRDRILRATVSKQYLRFVYEMALASQEAKKASVAENAGAGSANEEVANASGLFEKRFELRDIPEDFEPRYLRGFESKQLEWDEQANTFIVRNELADKDYKQILLAGSDPEFRRALNEIYVTSASFKVSASWLLWFYILCTLGELCLSPVGLSMVSKLAPARFATMLMGMWLLTSFFGGFLAGMSGEQWGKVDPYMFFGVLGGVVMLASLICLLFSKKISAMMHGVK